MYNVRYDTLCINAYDVVETSLTEASRQTYHRLGLIRNVATPPVSIATMRREQPISRARVADKSVYDCHHELSHLTHLAHAEYFLQLTCNNGVACAIGRLG